MNKKDVQELLTKSDQELSNLIVVVANVPHIIQNLEAQRDDVLNRIKQVESVVDNERKEKVNLENQYLAKIEKLNEVIKSQQETIDVLGGTEAGERMKREKAIKEREEAIRKAQKELEELTKDKPKMQSVPSPVKKPMTESGSKPVSKTTTQPTTSSQPKPKPKGKK